MPISFSFQLAELSPAHHYQQQQHLMGNAAADAAAKSLRALR
jgi:hypothetical protein